MDARAQIFGQYLIDFTVLIDAIQPVQRISHDPDAEVAFAQGMAPGMTGMLVAFVNDLQLRRCEGHFQLLLDSCANWSQIRHPNSSCTG